MMKSIKSVMKNMFSWNHKNRIKKSVEESTKEEQVRLQYVIDMRENFSRKVLKDVK